MSDHGDDPVRTRLPLYPPRYIHHTLSRMWPAGIAARRLSPQSSMALYLAGRDEKLKTCVENILDKLSFNFIMLQMFVRLFVDENLDRHVPISKQPKEKIQAIIDSCTRQFPEYSVRARKRIRTYLKSCRRTKRSREQAGLDTNNVSASSLRFLLKCQLSATAPS